MYPSGGHTNAYDQFYFPHADGGQAVNKDSCSICSGDMLKDSSGDKVCPRNFCREMRMSAQHGRHDLFLMLVFGPSIKESELYKDAVLKIAQGKRWLQ